MGLWAPIVEKDRSRHCCADNPSHRTDVTARVQEIRVACPLPSEE